MSTVPNDSGNFGLSSRFSRQQYNKLIKKEFCSTNISLLIPEVTEVKDNTMFLRESSSSEISPQLRPKYLSKSVTHTRVSNGGKHAPTLLEVK